MKPHLTPKVVTRGGASPLGLMIFIPLWFGRRISTHLEKYDSQAKAPVKIIT